MSENTSPTPLTSHLARVISNGHERSTKSALSVTAANVWVMQARAAVARIYGSDTPEVDYWCPAPSSDRDRSPQEKLLTRLGALELLHERFRVPRGRRVFIGHGRSAEWLKLHLFLSRTLSLNCDEFNVEPIAGIHTAKRIESMLASASMAFLVMTAEDTHADNTVHARQNVVHEVGLFQARLGPRRAIVLLEQGCSRFSNLDGLTTINFPIGDITARSEEVRGVLAREGLL
jgi:hypothetical protein